MYVCQSEIVPVERCCLTKVSSKNSQYIIYLNK